MLLIFYVNVLEYCLAVIDDSCWLILHRHLPVFGECHPSFQMLKFVGHLSEAPSINSQCRASQVASPESSEKIGWRAEGSLEGSSPHTTYNTTCCSAKQAKPRHTRREVSSFFTHFWSHLSRTAYDLRATSLLVCCVWCRATQRRFRTDLSPT